MADPHSKSVEPSPERSSAGFSLIELIVAMAVFTVFIVIFLASVVGLTRGTTQARVTAEATSGVLTVFQNIDRQVRYADAINFPGQSVSTGYRYIEFRTPAASMATNVTTCNQWRYLPDLNRIESRSWVDASGSTPTPWSTKLTAVVSAPEVSYPFKMVPATGTAKQQLALTLVAGNSGASSNISTTFVARNSKGSPTNAVGANGQSLTPVCQFSGVRP